METTDKRQTDSPAADPSSGQGGAAAGPDATGSDTATGNSATTTETHVRAEAGYPPGGHDYGRLTFDALVDFIDKWAHRFVPEAEPTPQVPPAPPSRFSLTLFLLKLLPYVTGAGFIVSIFWDFSGSFTLPWRAEPIQLTGLLRMLTVTGLVGFGTNWLAIKMLFYPRKKRPLLGQGLIPSRKDRIVLKLGEQISKEIINSQLILEQIRKSGLVTKYRARLTNSMRDIMASQEFRKDLMRVVEHYVNTLLKSPEIQEQISHFVSGLDFENLEGMESGFVKVYRFFKGDVDLAEHLRGVVSSVTFRMDHLDDQLSGYLDNLPNMIEEKADSLEEGALSALVFLIEQVNVQKVITENLKEFDEIRLERVLWSSTSDQLQYIQYLGCFLGLIGGLFIWQPLESIVIMGAMAAVVYGLDTLLFRRQQRKANEG